MSCIGGWRFGSYRLVLWKGKVRCGHMRNPTAFANQRFALRLGLTALAWIAAITKLRFALRLGSMPLAWILPSGETNRICWSSLSQACSAVVLLPHRERSGKSCRCPGGSLVSKLGFLFFWFGVREVIAGCPVGAALAEQIFDLRGRNRRAHLPEH